MTRAARASTPPGAGGEPGRAGGETDRAGGGPAGAGGEPGRAGGEPAGPGAAPGAAPTAARRPLQLITAKNRLCAPVVSSRPSGSVISVFSPTVWPTLPPMTRIRPG